MHCFDFEAVVVFDENGNGEIYCNECVPDRTDIENGENVHPIFCDSELDCYPTCSVCGKIHDYVSLTPQGYQHEMEAYFDKLCNEYDTDKFMTPYLYYGEYVECVNEYYETFYFPTDILSKEEIEKEGYEIEQTHNGYYIRASANGYLDCNDWEPIDSFDDLLDWFDSNYEPLEEE